MCVMRLPRENRANHSVERTAAGGRHARDRTPWAAAVGHFYRSAQRTLASEGLGSTVAP